MSDKIPLIDPMALQVKGLAVAIGAIVTQLEKMNKTLEDINRKLK